MIVTFDFIAARYDGRIERPAPGTKTVFGTGSGRAKVDRSDLVNSENENGKMRFYCHAR